MATPRRDSKGRFVKKKKGRTYKEGSHSNIGGKRHKRAKGRRAGKAPRRARAKHQLGPRLADGAFYSKKARGTKKHCKYCGGPHKHRHGLGKYATRHELIALKRKHAGKATKRSTVRKPAGLVKTERILDRYAEGKATKKQTETALRKVKTGWVAEYRAKHKRARAKHQEGPRTASGKFYHNY